MSVRMAKGSQAPYEDWDKILSEEKKKWKELEDKYNHLLKDSGVSVIIYSLGI